MTDAVGEHQGTHHNADREATGRGRNLRTLIVGSLVRA